MVDVHSHILPGMDDGSQSVMESAEILAEMQKQGVKVVAATPHFDMRQEGPFDFLMRRRKSMESLAGIIPAGMCVVPGAEVLYCGVSLHTVEKLEQLCIGNSRYLLIETLVPEWTDEFYSDLQYLMMERNITPILAHIERYYYVGKNRKMIHKLSSEGAILQMNAEAFLKPKMSRRAFKILRKEPVRLLGTDCHNMTFRPPNLGGAVEKIAGTVGQETVNLIMTYAHKILSSY